MATPRSEQIDLASTPYYHCYTRCVRRSYLCGKDSQTGKDFNHRRHWIVERLKHLSTIFAIEISAFSIMSNHYHLVLYVNTQQAEKWSKDEIIARWQQLFPGNAKKWQSSAALLDERVIIWRERLTNVSWFMRCLNEAIACRANDEDDCTGHFWEGRFKSQALLDEGALLAAMAYVDLNPIRAKLAFTPEDSDFTSIQERIIYLQQQGLLKDFSPERIELIDAAPQPPQLLPFSNSMEGQEDELPTIPFALSEYLELVDTTGRLLKEDKAGVIPQSLAPILERLSLTTHGWLTMVQGIETQFSHAVGQERMLFIFGQKRNKLLKGRKAAARFYLPSAA